MRFLIVTCLTLLATSVCAQDQADPTLSKTGDPSGAIRALSDASEGKPNKEAVQVPKLGPHQSAEPKGTATGTPKPE